MAGKAEWLQIVVASYRFDLDDASWLEGIAAAASPSLDHGLGLMAASYDASAPSRFRFLSSCARGMSPVLEEISRRANDQTPEEVLRNTYLGRPFGTISEVLGEGHKDAFSIFEPYGMRDILGINAADPSGVGCILFAPLGKISRPSTRLKSLGERVAAHIAAGFRLRRQLAGPGGASWNSAEAILEPSGRVQHASVDAAAPDALSALRQAARSIDRARADHAVDTNEALAIWKALVAGRWSLVDEFDTDGRRFFIARKNEPQPHTQLGLTLRERQVVAYVVLGHSNKLIAYELGLSTSTIGTHLSVAMAKLGLSSRAALIQVFNALGEVPSVGPERKSRK